MKLLHFFLQQNIKAVNEYLQGEFLTFLSENADYQALNANFMRRAKLFVLSHLIRGAQKEFSSDKVMDKNNQHLKWLRLTLVFIMLHNIYISPYTQMI